MASFEGALRRIPVVRAILPFIAGIIVAEGDVWGMSFQAGMVISASLFIVALATHLLQKHYSRIQTLHGFTLVAAFFFSGICITCARKETFRPLVAGKSVQCVATVSDFPQEKKKTYKVPVTVHYILENNRWKPACSKAIAFVKKDSTIGTVSVGDTIVIEAAVDSIKDFATKGHFSYMTYMAHRQVYNQLWVKKGRWKLVARDSHFSLKKAAARVCATVNGIYLSAGLPGPETAVLGALMLGVRSDMSAELLNAYSATGAMHILAVSGLHVGILYLILSWVLFFMAGRWLKVCKSLIIIACIWFYAFMTGFSPSIERAAIMFSLIALAQLLDSDYDIYNTLAATAFVCLLVNPHDLYDIGFQLSFLAILGIVYCGTYFSTLYEPSNLLVKKLYELVTVSLAAQVLTLPLSMYYFGQIPTYFLLTNLVAIPVSFVVMVLGVAVIPLYFMSNAVFVFTSVILGWFVWLQNYSILLISRLPSSAVRIDFSFAAMLVTYCLLVIVVVIVEYHRFRHQ